MQTSTMYDVECMGVHRVGALGLGRSTITRRVASGQLIRVLPTIYATEKPDYLGLCRAVTLWKPQAVLSHLSAAWVWGLLAKEPQCVYITLPLSAGRRGPAWVEIHRRRVEEKCRRRGLPVVTRIQTFVDVASTLTGPELERFFDTAIRTPAERREIAVACVRSTGMAGMKELRRQLRTCVPNTRSEPERILGRAMSARNFHMEINVRVGPYYGDFVDYVARVIVEVDGREHHVSPEAFNNDRRRQNFLVLGGWLILRYSAVQVMADPDGVAEQVMSAVRRRRRSRE
ncbi:DUF559 domain-containing protein [Actinomycetes bacterium M1A6_2h]